MPRLSVILPVRNGLPDLRTAVQSTLRALPPDSELVIHDDASDDGTPDYLDSITDSRVRVLSSATPRGVAGGLNLLLDSVDCEYVGRMDADDITLPWRFRHQLRALRRDADVCFTGVIYFGSEVRFYVPFKIGSSAFPLHLLMRNPVTHSSMCGRLDSIVGVGGYRPVPAEDYDLWMRLAAEGARLVRTAPPGVLYRVHSQQITASDQWRRAARCMPGYADSYERLSHYAVSADPTWFRALRRLDVLDDDERQRRLSELSRLIDREAKHVGWTERRALRAAQRRYLGG